MPTRTPGPPSPRRFVPLQVRPRALALRERYRAEAFLRRSHVRTGVLLMILADVVVLFVQLGFPLRDEYPFVLLLLGAAGIQAAYAVRAPVRTVSALLLVSASLVLPLLGWPSTAARGLGALGAAFLFLEASVARNPSNAAPRRYVEPPGAQKEADMYWVRVKSPPTPRHVGFLRRRVEWHYENGKRVRKKYRPDIRLESRPRSRRVRERWRDAAWLWRCPYRWFLLLLIWGTLGITWFALPFHRLSFVHFAAGLLAVTAFFAAFSLRPVIRSIACTVLLLGAALLLTLKIPLAGIGVGGPAAFLLVMATMIR